MKKLENLSSFKKLNEQAMKTLKGGFDAKVQNRLTGIITKETSGGSKASSWCASSGCITYKSDVETYSDNGVFLNREYKDWADCDGAA